MPQAKTIYFFHEEGCGVCAAAGAVLEKWSDSHPEVMVVWLDLTRHPWVKHGFDPRKTPAYLLEVDFKPSGKPVEGGLKAKELDRFAGVV